MELAPIDIMKIVKTAVLFVHHGPRFPWIEVR